MILVLLEQECNCINSVIECVIEKYDESSIVRISGSRIDSETISTLSRKPLLSSGWLILCDHKISTFALKTVNKPFNSVIIKVTSRSKLQYVLSNLSSLEYNYIDNYYPSEDELYTWIGSRLNCSKATTTALLSRCNNRLPKIVQAVDMLSCFDKVTPKMITQYIEKTSAASVEDIVLYLLKVQRKGIAKAEVMQTVSQFRYAYKWLLETIEGELLLFQYIFSAIAVGELSLQNYKEYKLNSEEKRIIALSEFKMRRIIEFYESVSCEYLFYVSSYVQSIPKKQFGLYKLMQLIKIIGG